MKILPVVFNPINLLLLIALIRTANSFWINHNFAKSIAISPRRLNTGVRQRNWSYHLNYTIPLGYGVGRLLDVWINKLSYLRSLSPTVYVGPTAASKIFHHSETPTSKSFDFSQTTTSKSLDLAERIQGPDGKPLPPDIFGARLTPDAEGVDIRKPFYKPTIEDSISLRMCREYFRSRTVFARKVQGQAVIEGVDAKPRQFPHLAVLGYGDSNNNNWACGGTLISDQYVLTAAHCITSTDFGKVRRVRLGELNLDSTTDDDNVKDFTIANTITHPLYNFRASYHDIALIRLNGSITSFNEYINPACLATTRDNLDKVQLRIAGWGTTEVGGSRAGILQTAILNLVPQDRCRKIYSRARTLRDGILEDIHICADGGATGSDACKGDSGGPLQFINSNYAEEGIRPFVEIVGIISFGRSCARAPGVYTRVLPYVKWIESEVWSRNQVDKSLF